MRVANTSVAGPMVCPVCRTDLRGAPRCDGRRDVIHYDCPRCGQFALSLSAVEDLPETLRRDPDAPAKLSHALRRASDAATHDLFSTYTIEEVLKRPLPRPKEQADLLIRWLAKQASGPGELLQVSPESHSGIIGAKSAAGFSLVLDHLFAKGLVTGNQLRTNGVQGQAQATLSFAGWEYYEQLAKGGAVYRKAFMAMKFGEPALERMLADVFRPAAAMAGFDLFKLDDVPKAGLIDDRLRVEIQASDFVIADLSHDNLGAYWEAGYAEGLGKPVIYTCEQAKFETTKTHFDTNHHLTIVWDPGKPDEAGNALKATIRATLPHVAKQTDGDV
jgi:hypothetical protein